MASINFAEMYLVPREIYLRIINSVNNENMDPLFFTSSKTTKPTIVQHEHHFQPPPSPRAPPPPPPNNIQNPNQQGYTPSQTDSENGGNPPPPDTTRPNSESSKSNAGMGGDLSSTGLTESDFEMRTEEDKPGDESEERFSKQQSEFFTKYRTNDSRKKISSSSSLSSNKKSHPKNKKKREKNSSSSLFSSASSAKSGRAKKIGENYPSFDKKFAKQKTTLSQSDSSDKNSKKSYSKKKKAQTESYPSADPQFSRENIETRSDSSDKNSKKSYSKKKQPQTESYPSAKPQFSRENIDTRSYPSVPPEFSRENIGTRPKVSKEQKPSKQPQSTISQESLSHLLRIINTPEHNPFLILDLPENSSIKEIKKAFKHISIFIHPDKCKHPDAHSAFTKLSNAYNAIIQFKNEQREDRGDYSYASAPSNESQSKGGASARHAYFRPGASGDSSFRSGSAFTQERKRPSTFFGSSFPKHFKYPSPPKTKRGPPTTPLRPPQSARDFREKFGYGIKKWLKL